MEDLGFNFQTQTRWLDDVLDRRCKMLAKRSGKSIEEVSIMMGRVATMLGVTFLGVGLKVPHQTALPIGEAALEEFQRIADSSN